MHLNEVGGYTPDGRQEENVLFNVLAWSGNPAAIDLAENLIGTRLVNEVAGIEQPFDLTKQQGRIALTALTRASRGKIGLYPENKPVITPMLESAQIPRLRKLGLILRSF